MISIIICSRNKDIPSAQKENIERTIGTPFEWVIIDNSANQYNIFTAYNEGVARAKGDILCFMHDDILMHTTSWGEVIARQLTDTTIGVIGVAGSHFLSSAPLYWYAMPFTAQYNLTNDNGKQTLEEHGQCYHDDLADVAAVDGMCFFARRELFETVTFDNKTYSGFHAYDMDICLQVLACGWRVCVTRSILVEHFWSEASCSNRRYMKALDDNMQLFAAKWASHLPMVQGFPLAHDEMRSLDRLCHSAYDAHKARHSKAYRIGQLLLSPTRWAKRQFHRL